MKFSCWVVAYVLSGRYLCVSDRLSYDLSDLFDLILAANVVWSIFGGMRKRDRCSKLILETYVTVAVIVDLGRRCLLYTSDAADE